MKKISLFRYLMSKNEYQKDFFGTSFSYPFDFGVFGTHIKRLVPLLFKISSFIKNLSVSALIFSVLALIVSFLAPTVSVVAQKQKNMLQVIYRWLKTKNKMVSCNLDGQVGKLQVPSSKSKHM